MIPRKAFYVISALGLLLAACIAYANTLNGDWVWDDASSVLSNKHVQDPHMFFQLFREDQHPFGKGEGNFYRPLVAVSFMADFMLSYAPRWDDPATPYPDVKPFIFHVANTLMHAVAAILLCFLLLRLEAPRWVAFLSSLLFVLHPLHTEAVAYISGRADMMSAVFMFAGLWLALSPSVGRRRIVAHAFSALAFVAALLSKEASLIYPVLLALLLFLQPREVPQEDSPRARPLLRYLPLLFAIVLVVIYAALRATILHFGSEQASAAAPFLQRLGETGQAFAFYIQKLFLPTNLHMEQTLADTPAWTGALGWALIALIMAAAVAAGVKGQRRIVMGLAWFLAAWLPISGLFPLNAPMAEHWMYVPMAGFWWALCEALWLLAAPRPVLRPVFGTALFLLCLLFLHLTMVRNEAWGSNETLFRATLAQNPASLRVQYNLAVTYEDLTRNTAGARRHFEKVLAEYQAQKEANPVKGNSNYLLDDEIEVRLSLARLYLLQGMMPEAATQFGLLVNTLSDPKWAAVRGEATLGLGRALLAMGEFAGASQVLAQAAQMNPEYEAQLRALMVEGAPAVPVF